MKRVVVFSILTFTLSFLSFAQTPNGFDRTATSSIQASLDKDGHTLITTILGGHLKSGHMWSGQNRPNENVAGD